MSTESKALNSTGGASKGCLLIFGGIFVAAGGAVLWFATLQPMWHLLNARSWVETPCVIDSSELITNHDDDGTTYRPDIRYSYAFGDGDYEGDRYTFNVGSSSGYERHQAVIDRYPPGSASVCFVNPNAPEESVLYRGLIGDYFFGLLGIPFIAAGGFVILVGSWQGKKKAAKSYGAKAVGHMTTEEVGEMILKPKSGPVGRFIGLTIISLIWNGITFGVLYAMISDEEQGGVSFIVYLFMTPFVLIGLALIAGMGYAFLAMFNPRVLVKVSQGAPRLGSEIEIRWTVSGSSTRIHELKIALEGREEARYTRGTDTYTDKHTFETIEVYKTSNPRDIRIGSAVFTIPEYTMHSFDGGNNKIVWEIKVSGNIDRWPDVNDEYEFEVRPLAIGGAR